LSHEITKLKFLSLQKNRVNQINILVSGNQKLFSLIELYNNVWFKIFKTSKSGQNYRGCGGESLDPHWPPEAGGFFSRPPVLPKPTAVKLSNFAKLILISKNYGLALALH